MLSDSTPRTPCSRARSSGQKEHGPGVAPLPAAGPVSAPHGRGSLAAVLEGRSPDRAGEKSACLSDSLQQARGDAPGGSAHGTLPEMLAALHRDAKQIIISKK